jgi:GH15 family glucan-1,4-alpha-glucosidase
MVDWLPGYENAKPVRIGNRAHSQLQLDVYGEVMDALYQAARGGLATTEEEWALLKAFLAHLSKVWREPDCGIWESRGTPRHFTFSKIMAWVAFDRGIRMIQEFWPDGPVAEWRAVAAQIRSDILAHGYNPELGSFVQSYDSNGWMAAYC